MLAGHTSLYQNDKVYQMQWVMRMSNRLGNYVNKINSLPKSVRPWLLTKLFCSQVKYANTTGIKITHISNQLVTIDLPNKKKVQNHIGGVHAVAAALLAESASGIVFGINVPDSQIPLIKTMTFNYTRRMQGALTATATLSNEQLAVLQQSDKGEMMIDVVITDESNEQPIECSMLWAWVPKRLKN